MDRTRKSFKSGQIRDASTSLACNIGDVIVSDCVF